MHVYFYEEGNRPNPPLDERGPRPRCPAHTRSGARCLDDTGHKGVHVSPGGWFRADGGSEFPLQPARSPEADHGGDDV
jgi:hypothetical protein